MISSMESSLEHPRYSQEYLNHVTFAPPRGGRPDGAGWLARRVQTGRRVKSLGRWCEGGTNRALSSSGCSLRSTLCTRPARCAGDLAMAMVDLAYHRPRSTMQVPRNDHPRHRSPLSAVAVGVCWHHPLPEHHRLAPLHWCWRTCPHEWLYRIIMNISRRARAVWP